MTLYGVIMNIVLRTVAGNEVETNFIQFSGGERHVQLGQLPVKPKFTLFAVLQNSNDLMDLLLLKNALDHAYQEKVEIYLEIPYLPYARQDRVCAPGQAFSLELIANMLNSLNAVQIVVWDCHSRKGLELTGAKNIEPSLIIKSSNELRKLLTAESTVLVCPDKGAVSRCEEIQRNLGVSTMIRCEKRRDPATGKITRTDVLCGDLSGKHAVITDDICDGGFTFTKIAEQLKEKNVASITLYVTHGIFSKGLNVFEGLIDQIYTTTSFTNEQGANLSFINFNYNFGEKL